MQKQPISTKQAFTVIADSVKNDTDYGHAWHRNIVESVLEIEENYDLANQIAESFMQRVFDVNTDFSEYFKNRVKN
jgi:hypothetical protein